MTPYFITNEKEYEEILKPLLLSWGYRTSIGTSPNWKRCDKLILNDEGKFGKIWAYESLDTNTYNRYLEPNIHKFLKTAAELMGKEYKPFLGNKDVVWCPTEKLANRVLKIADKLGYRWESKESFTECSNWSVYKQNTCYYISDGLFGSKQKAIMDEYSIIPAEEFINFYKDLEMEKRNIAISLNEAKEWYKSGNNTLKELALKAYSEEELNPITFSQIWGESKVTTPSIYTVPVEECSIYTQLHKLSTIAKYFNKDWKKTTSNVGYFIGGIDENGIIKINAHNTVVYPGVVYFKNKEDLIKAIKMIDINRLFGINQ